MALRLHMSLSRAARRLPVLHIKSFRPFVFPLLVVGLLMAWPNAADAQRRRPVRTPVVRSVVYVGAFGYPRYRYYSPWFQYGSPWGPSPYPYPPYGYGYGIRDTTSSIRLDVSPRNAQVYVDGYSAGPVDDFDGIFQRLRIRPGNHEIVLVLDGYKTIRQSLYLNPGSDQKISFAMERLGPGETAEAPPPPSAPEREDAQPPAQRYPFEPRGMPPAPRESSNRFGTLSIRVQPGDAEILIDGEKWTAPADQDRITIQLSEGRHHVEIRKQGFAQYTEDVLVRRDNTLSLNVSLLRGAADGR